VLTQEQPLSPLEKLDRTNPPTILQTPPQSDYPFSKSPCHPFNPAPRAVSPPAAPSSQSSCPSPSPCTRPCPRSCRLVKVGGQCRRRSYHGVCWRSIHVLWCRRGRCRCSGIAAARAVVACGVCLPVRQVRAVSRGRAEAEGAYHGGTSGPMRW